MSSKHKRRSGGRQHPQPASTAETPEAKPSLVLPAFRRPPLWLIAGVLILMVGLAAFLVLGSPLSSKSPTASRAYTSGGVTYCRETPKFVQDLNVGNNTAFSTSERELRGLVLIIPPTTTGGQRRLYRLPSWSNAGNLGPVELSRGGNLFAAPAPSINVLYNPPDEQNQVYQVISSTGVLSPFMSLPRAGPASPENPFGVLGLGFDCDTNKLYVSSVAGSTREREIGRIYTVDVDKKTAVAQLDNIDPLGLAVYNSAKSKRLYYGLARWPEVWSIELDDKGNFQGQPRLEFSLANLGPRGSDKARKLEFALDNQLVVHGIEFSFNLIAPTEKQETLYYYKYDPTTDKWLLQSDPPK